MPGLIFQPAIHLVTEKPDAFFFNPVQDGLELIEQCVNIFENYEMQTEVLAASVRHVPHVIACAELGADVATIPFKVLESLMMHPLTDKGLAQFLADHQKLNG